MKKMKKSTISDFILGIVLMLFALLAFFLSWGPLETLEHGIYDLNAQLRVKPSTAPVAVIAIDEQSIANLGRWPWPRASIASMVDLLQSYNVKVIGLDIIYSEKDVNQGLLEVRNLITGIESDPDYVKKGLDVVLAALKEAESRLDNDTILAKAITAGKNVVLPLFFVPGSPTGRVAVGLPEYLQNNALPPPGADNSITARAIVPPIADFAAGSMGLGHINIIADRDGTVRSEPLFINFEEKLFPSFALQLTLKYLNIDLKTLQLGKEIKFGRKTIPVDDNNRMLISFAVGIPYYSFFDVTNKKIAPEVFKDKIVIIAQSAAGLGTMQVTPTAVNVPPGTIIANVIENIINDDHLVRPEWAITLELIMIIIFGLYIALVIPQLKAGISAIVSLVLLLAWMSTATYLFAAYGYWIKALYPALILIVGYVVIVSKRYLLTEKTKDRIEADSVETNKMLGLSFQGQGLLDMAFDKFRKCPVEDESVKELLYNLGLDFERKRMFNKAVAVYEHISQAGNFKDINERVKKLNVAGETMIFGLSGAKKEATVIMDNTEIKPTLGRYEIVKELGRGAMGTVFLGKDPRINREVAIKVLPRRLSENREYVERFYKEGRAAARLNHNNIVQAIDVGEASGYHYFVMEYVKGTTVYDRLSRGEIYSEKEALDIIIQIADALGHAHERGLIHRDVKPKNIMITENGIAKLADMGLAREAADQVAAQMEAGRAPTPSAVMHKHLKEILVPPDHINSALSVGVAEVIEVMMAKKRSDRYGSIKMLMEDLKAVQEGRPPLQAHQKFDAHVLVDLEKGGAERDQEQETASESDSGKLGLKMAIIILSGALVIAFLVIIILLNKSPIT
ncbi:MAG: Serine/threonine-protein kinase PknB [Planctomycetes bacterium ADurb.Bin412]|nr:MAG: Serine/threonine-protein kinase PknB [Planctomycetes bacterium ADurb.Bin412]